MPATPPADHGAAAEALGLTRRGAVTTGFYAFCTVALAQHLAACAPMRRMAATDWIDRQAELARGLKSGAISPGQWMSDVTGLASEIDVAELMHDVGRAQLSENPPPETNDPRKTSVRFIDAAGQPRRLGYAAALFRFAPHNVITPHGHRNMASAHLVVDGRLRVRNFDRLGDDAGGVIIRPTRDAVMGVGALSAMTSAHDNIHWFVPQHGPAATFDVIISGLDASQPDYEIMAIDPLAGASRPDGSIVAPIISFADASDKYSAAL